MGVCSWCCEGDIGFCAGYLRCFDASLGELCDNFLDFVFRDWNSEGASELHREIIDVMEMRKASEEKSIDVYIMLETGLRNLLLVDDER